MLFRSTKAHGPAVLVRRASWVVLLLLLLGCCEGRNGEQLISRSVQVSSMSEMQAALDHLLSGPGAGAQIARLTVSGLKKGKIHVDAPLNIPSDWTTHVQIVGRASEHDGGRVVFACSSKSTKQHLQQATAAGASVIAVRSNANFSLQGVAIVGCSTPVPTVLITPAAAAHLTDIELSNNTNTGASANAADGGSGAGVVCNGCQQLLLERVIARNNIATGRGGVVFVQQAGSAVVVRDSLFVLNAAAVDGGSMTVVDTDAVLERVVFFGSHCKTEFPWSCSGGAVAIESTTGSAAMLMARNVKFDNCSSGFQGGAVMMTDAALRWQSVACTNCKTQNAGGACIYSTINLAGAPEFTIHNSTFLNNSAMYVGGAIGIYSGNATVRDSVFSNNQVGDSGYGGGIHFEGQGGLWVENTIFVNNNATFRGGGISAARPIASFFAINVSFIDNKANDMGAGAFCDTISCHLHNCSIRGNIAGVAGAGVASVLSPSVRITRSDIANNKAKSAAGMRHVKAAQLLVADSHITSNEAHLEAGGAYLAWCPDSSFTNTSFTNNKAAYGGALAAYFCASLAINTSSFEGNQAAAGLSPSSTEGVQVFLIGIGDLVVAGRGGAITAGMVNVTLQGVSIVNNSADVSAGGLLLQQGSLTATNSSWQMNRAGSGPGGGLLVEGSSMVTLQDAQFSGNSASSGGGVVIAHVGEEQVEAVMTYVTFENNTAVAGTGGAVSVTGLPSLRLSHCNLTGNTASSSGGGLFCQGCRSLHLSDSDALLNTAGGSGGAFCCLNCTQLLCDQLTAAGNVAGEGAAITVSGLTMQSALNNSRFTNNTAAADALAAMPVSVRMKSAAADAQQQAWQAVCGDEAGSGGAVCLQHCSPVIISDSNFLGNTGRTGGGVFQSSCQSQAAASAAAGGENRVAAAAASTASRNAVVNYADVDFDQNKAVGGGGGAIYTTDAERLHFDSVQPSNEVIERLAQNNAAVGAVAYGNGLASSSDSLQITSIWSTVELKAEVQSRRLLLQSSQDTAGGSSRDSSSSSSSSGDGGVLKVESSKLSSLDVKLLDAYHSIVSVIGQEASLTIRLSSGQLAADTAAMDSSTSSSGSAQCAQQCTAPAAGGNATPAAAGGASCFTGCLSGATTVAFQEGQAVFDSLRFQAPPNTSWTLHLLPLGVPGLQALQVPLEVMHCGAGELVTPADTSCQLCLSYQYSFDPMAGCTTCPQPGGCCTNGLLTPLPGFWQSHPRSNQLHRCPHVAACTPASALAVLSFQRQHKYELNASNIADLTSYMQAQCAEGYMGRLCESCNRSAGYSLGPGRRCVVCPRGLAASAVAFLLARLVDLLAVSGLVALWSHAATTGGGRMEVDVARGKVRNKVGRLAVFQFFSMVYLTWAQLTALLVNSSAAAWHLQPWASGILSALLITPQSTWRWVGVECLLRSSAVSPSLVLTVLEICYPVFLAPAAVLLGTLVAHLLQACHNRRMEAADVSVPVVEPTLSAKSSHPAAGAASPASPATTATAELRKGLSTSSSPVPESLDSRPSSVVLDWAVPVKGVVASVRSFASQASIEVLQWMMPSQHIPVFTVAVLVSLSYCFTSICYATVGAFRCLYLDRPASDSEKVPGLMLGAMGSYWAADLQETCGSRQHVAAAAFAALVGVPCIVGLLLWYLTACAAFRMSLPRKPASAAGAAQTPAAALAAFLDKAAANGSTSSNKLQQQAPLWQRVIEGICSLAVVKHILHSPVQIGVGSLCVRMLRPPVWWWPCLDLLGRLLMAVAVVVTALSPQHAVQALAIQAAISLLQMMHLVCQPEADVRCRYVAVAAHCLVQTVAMVFVAISAGTSIAGEGWHTAAASTVFGLCVCGCGLAFVAVICVASRRCSATTVQYDMGWRRSSSIGRSSSAVYSQTASLKRGLSVEKDPAAGQLGVSS